MRERQGGADRNRDGFSDDIWIEVIHRHVPGSGTSHAGKWRSWASIDGSEQVILGDLSILTDGGPVRVALAKGGTKVAAVSP